MSAEVEQLHKDLAFSKQSNRPDAEAVVISTQATIRGVLIEIERLRDRCAKPQYYTLPAPKLTAAQKKAPSPVPVIPWSDYGRARHG